MGFPIHSTTSLVHKNPIHEVKILVPDSIPKSYLHDLLKKDMGISYYPRLTKKINFANFTMMDDDDDNYLCHYQSKNNI